MHRTETPVLIRPDEKYLQQIADYRLEFFKYNSSMDGTGSLRRTEDPREWLAITRQMENPETVPEDRVQATQFLYVRDTDNRLLGMIQVRPRMNEYLSQCGGNIGYSIRPSERQKGYAKQMLADALPYCREIGLSKVLITCRDDNEPSRHTILANGGIYENTVYDSRDNEYLERYWITL